MGLPLAALWCNPPQSRFHLIRRDKSWMKRAYLSNKDLLNEIVECQKSNQVSNKLATMLMLMVERLSQKPNYRNYSFVQDMQAEALYQLCKTNNPIQRSSSRKPDPRPNVLKFDPSFAERSGKSPNPFSYVTQIIANTFRRCIKDEGKLAEFRDDALEDGGHTPSYRRQMHNEANRSNEPIPLKPTTGRPRKQLANSRSNP